MEREKLVQVLLATYNGERFLLEQLDSLSRQTYGRWRLLVSDDGSSDGTLSVLEAYVSREGRARIVDGGASHGGACANFLSLLSYADAPYVAFCDQDDVWLPHKLGTLVDAMGQLERRYPEGKPLAVFTDLAVVDDSLATISPSHMAHVGVDPRRCSLANLLVENKAPGCSMLVNRALYQEALRLPEGGEGVIMHDWWLMLTAAALGAIGYVDRPTALYRQTGGNAVGARANGARASLGRMARGISGVVPGRDQVSFLESTTAQARAFAAAYGRGLSERQRALCEGYGSLLSMAPAGRVAFCARNDVLNSARSKRLAMARSMLLYEWGKRRLS